MASYILTRKELFREIASYHQGNYQNENTLYDFDDLVREAVSTAVNNVLNGVERETWIKVDFPRLVKIWNDYVKMDFVRDEKGVDEIADRLVRNIAQLTANYKLILENAWKEEMEGQYCFKEPEVEPDPDYVPPEPVDPKQLKIKYRDQRGKFWSAYPPQEKMSKRNKYCEQLPMTEEEFQDKLSEYVTMVSDYATEPLVRLAYQLMEATEAEKKLVICDNILNVVHANGDLAALFIPGGSHALSALSGEHTAANYHPYNWGERISTYANESTSKSLTEELKRMKELMK